MKHLYGGVQIPEVNLVVWGLDLTKISNILVLKKMQKDAKRCKKVQKGTGPFSIVSVFFKTIYLCVTWNFYFWTFKTKNQPFDIFCKQTFKINEGGFLSATILYV